MRMWIHTRLSRAVGKFMAATNGRPKTRRSTVRLALEELENRLVPSSSNQVSVIANSDGRLEAFQINANGTDVWHSWQWPKAGGSWTAWASLGSPSGYSLQYLKATRNAGGTLEVFVTDTSIIGTDHVYRINQITAGGSWVASWTDMGGAGTNTIKGLDVAPNIQDGRLEVFALRSDDHIVHQWQMTAQGSWSGSWSDLGDPIMGGSGILDHVDKIAVGQNAPGDPVNQGLDVFALCFDVKNKQNYISESRQAGGTWSSWSALPSFGDFNNNPPSDMAVGLNLNNRMQVFVTTKGSAPDTRYNVQTIQQQTPGGLWLTWYTMGAPIGSTTNPLYLQVGRNQTTDPNTNGTLEIFASDGTSIFRLAQPRPNVQDWGSNWGTEGSPAAGTTIASFCVGQNKDGRLELFAITSEPHVYHDWQNWAAGDWSGWSPM
jgi:hypothetical protein